MSGVLMPMEVGVFRNCFSYASAAAMPAEVALALALAVLVLLALLVVVLLLLHAAMPITVLTAMAAARILLIRVSFPAGPRNAMQSSLDSAEARLRVTELVLKIGFPRTCCPDVTPTEAKMLRTVRRGGQLVTSCVASWGYLNRSHD